MPAALWGRVGPKVPLLGSLRVLRCCSSRVEKREDELDLDSAMLFKRIRRFQEGFRKVIRRFQRVSEGIQEASRGFRKKMVKMD